jgi:hypothetical protein
LVRRNHADSRTPVLTYRLQRSVESDRVGVQVSSKYQTFAVSPAEPGDFPLLVKG